MYAPGPLVEDLLDLRRPVLADVARLGREDDERVTVGRDDDVRVAVDDLEAGQVRDRPLEPRVLAARDDERVEPVLPHRLPYVRVAAIELCLQTHESSSALTSAVTAVLSGVGTPSSRPKRAMPPFR